MDRTVLIVEDDEALREMMATVLQDEGYTTLLAGHGQAAIELLQQQAVDMVLSDISMPVMDGLQLGIHCGQQYPHIPYVLMSGGSRDLHNQDEQKYLDSGGEIVGARYVLKKPFSLQQLVDVVNRCCQPQ